jgi:hypothetical protein
MVTTVKEIEIDTELLKTIKRIAKDKNTSINDVIKQGIEKIENENKILDHLIANKDTYNPDPERIMSMAGIIKTDKPVDVAKEISESRKMY